MKTKLLLLLLFFTAVTSAQIINIPDANFKYKLLSASPINIAAKNSAGAWVKIDVNSDGEIQQSEANLIYELYVSGDSANAITSLEGIQNFTNLTRLGCGNNQLSSLKISDLVNLTYLDCQDNKLSKLDIEPNKKLKSVYCSNNVMQELNLKGLANLQDVSIGENPLKVLNTQGLTGLLQFHANNTFLTELNLNDSPLLQYFTMYNNSLLTKINIKNGGKIKYPGECYFINNPLLKSICVDEGEEALIIKYFEGLDLTPIPITTDCDIVPTDSYNIISGHVTFDEDNAGCSSTSPSAIYTRMRLSDGANTRIQYVNSLGEYKFYVPVGDFKVTPEIGDPIYTFNPNEIAASFTEMNNTKTNQDFCIKSTSSFADVEMILTPVLGLRPGFSTAYRLILKNRGTHVMSGTVVFEFDGDVLTFVSASPAIGNTSKGLFTFNFTDLIPYQSRAVEVELNLNGPTQTPPVNLNDVLKFKATATVSNIVDNDLTNNTFEFNQVVRGSLDPNNIICAQGTEQPVTTIGDYLHYVINFENIGTAAADFVVITQDINPADFDIESLELLNTSHNVTANVKGNAVEFRFDGINLAAKAHGSIVYKIKSLKSLKDGDSVMNKASIVFDFNEAIATNEAVTTFKTILGADDFTVDKSVKIYPNPTKDVVRVETNNTIKNIQLYDVQGRVLQTVTPNQNTEIIDVSAKAAGIYFLKVTTVRGTKIEKLIKQ